ncbi:hypothetical protein [Streptomyces sp. NPDC057020]|uniref:hypothetical protein n=1 Tax=Streptomyces sp. NPDC057020 TaxID=3346002 RepID=UPI0036D33A8A
MRLGKRERAVLEWIADGEPRVLHRVPEWACAGFFYESQFQRHCERMEAKGLLRFEKRQFIRITELGLSELDKIEQREAAPIDSQAVANG